MSEANTGLGRAGLGAGLRGLVTLTLAGLWTTGAVWLVLRNFLESSGEFGRAPHPLEHPMLAAHGLFAFAALFLLGVVWTRHIAFAWRKGMRRPSGVLLVALTIVLIASGYLLYYAGDDGVRAKTSLIHEAVGLAALLPFLVHRFKKRAQRADRR
ncbi:MAG: hypothetical protein GC153_07565 [Alphaproteobacteria bacterium]|nr:hypothetical protein [Alphaproteobacteria bacterium]